MFVYYKWYILIELMFLKELMLIKKCIKRVIFVTISIVVSFSQISANLDIKDSVYHCIISLISKNESIKLMQHDDLTEKSGTL